MDQELDQLAIGGAKGKRRHKAAHEAGVSGQLERPAAPDEIKELHVCMGLNACMGHGVNGTGVMAGMGDCSTVSHVCHGDNNCRGQGACGYAGNDEEQAKPGDQACRGNGSCASPINVTRMSSAGPNKGKTVWMLARALFEQRMYEAGIPFGPSPGRGCPDDLVPSYEEPYEEDAS